MRFPKFIKRGDAIGFVAPSFGCDTEPYKTAFGRAQENFRNMGFGIQIGPNCYTGDGIGISNKPELCGQEINDYYTSEKNDALISCGGGELMCEILNYVDFDRLRAADPKWFMGYSDNTNLTFLLTTLCDTASIYGPCAAAFGQEPWHRSVADAMAVLQGQKLSFAGYDGWEKESLRDEEHPFLPYNITEPRVIKGYPEKFQVSGRMIGGCMDCLVNLIGTKFDHVGEFLERYKDDGFIWFLESCDLNVMSIRRAMWQMDNGGWFRYCKGFMIGRPLQFGQEMMGLDQYQAVLGIIGKYNVPVVMDVDLGHLSPMMPVVCGSMGTLMVDGQDMRLSMEMR